MYGNLSWKSQILALKLFSFTNKQLEDLLELAKHGRLFFGFDRRPDNFIHSRFDRLIFLSLPVRVISLKWIKTKNTMTVSRDLIFSVM